MMLDAALDHARRGWPIFPLHHPAAAGCSCNDRDCRNVGKHPRTRHGLKDATTELAVVRDWWTRWPEANIGARTGVAFDVLDIDHPDPVDAARWPDTLVMPGGPVVRTGNGWHFYLATTGQGNRAGLGGDPIDWRGRDGYVILPPSLHGSGHRYTWHAPAELELQPAPAELLAMLDPPKRPAPASVAHQLVEREATPGRWNPSGLLGRLAVAAEGTRNDVLNWAAHRVGVDVRNGRALVDDALAALDQLADVAMTIGLSDREIESTIRSGYSKGVAA